MRFHWKILAALALFGVDLASVNAAETDSACDSHFFDRANLEKLIQDGRAQSIAELLKLAPNCFKENQVAIYKSSSLQCATPKAPRIILYINDDHKGSTRGETICTFNSGSKKDYEEFYRKNPTIDCHENTLECQRFDTEKNRFEYFQLSVPKNDSGILFSESRTTPVLSKVNPPVCMTCHRGTEPFLGAPNPRPNLETYPAWPGFYGSLHDRLYSIPAERDMYLNQYARYKPENPRYATLPDMYDSNGEIIVANDNSKPVVNLQNLLAWQNQKRVAAEFTSPEVRDAVWPYRYALLGALDCNDDIRTDDSNGMRRETPLRQFPIESFLPRKLKKKLRYSFQEVASRALRLHQQNIRELIALESKVGEFEYDELNETVEKDLANSATQPYKSYHLADEHNFFNAARLAYIGMNLGLPVDDWAMSFRPTLDFTAGRHNLRELLPFFAAAFLDPEQDKDLTLNLDSHLGEHASPEQCELLRNKSLTALSGTTLARKTTKKTRNASSLSHVLNVCMSCHVHGDAPPISFGDRDKIKSELRKHATTNPKNKLLKEIILRVDSKDMPPNTTLSDAERGALKDYLKAIERARK